MSYQAFTDVIRVVRSDREGATDLAEQLAQPRVPATATPMFSPELSTTAVLALEQDPNVRAQIEQCRKQAELEGRALAEAAIAKESARYQNSITELDRAVNAAQATAEEVVELALVIAEELLGHTFAHNTEFLVETVSHALSCLPGAPEPTLRVCPDDAARIEAAAIDLQRVQVIPDPSLKAGDCVVEATDTVVDARIASRTAAVREALIDALAAEDSSP